MGMLVNRFEREEGITRLEAVVSGAGVVVAPGDTPCLEDVSVEFSDSLENTQECLERLRVCLQREVAVAFRGIIRNRERVEYEDLPGILEQAEWSLNFVEDDFEGLRRGIARLQDLVDATVHEVYDPIS